MNKSQPIKTKRSLIDLKITILKRNIIPETICYIIRAQYRASGVGFAEIHME